MIIKMFNPRLENWCQNFDTFGWSFHWKKHGLWDLLEGSGMKFQSFKCSVF